MLTIERPPLIKKHVFDLVNVSMWCAMTRIVNVISVQIHGRGFHTIHSDSPVLLRET